jgi:hypothetical protein
MLPPFLRMIFWDIDANSFVPEDWPDYSIFRVLEYGDDEAVTWMRRTFPEPEIRRVICTEHRLTPKSANFWALVYGIEQDDVAALGVERDSTRENR